MTKKELEQKVAELESRIQLLEAGVHPMPQQLVTTGTNPLEYAPFTC